MYGSIVWKLLLTLVIVGWAASNLVPLQETPFPEYIRQASTAHQDEFNALMDRTIVTSITTLLATGALWAFGGGVVNDFAFIFILGIITGTFSSIFIASPVFFWWHKGDRRHVEERKDVLPNYEWMASSKASK